jgi:hypothetical protein
LGRFYKNDRPSFITWNRVLVESKDSSKIRCPSRADCQVWKLSNNYCYDLILPNNFKGDAHDVMKADLDRVFGYNVKLEKRRERCFVLKRGEGGNRVISTGGKKEFDMNTDYLKMKNSSWKEMLFWLQNKYLYKTPIIDETGYDHVDIDINADLTNFEALSNALHPLGIDFVEEEREIDMLIIRDKNEPPISSTKFGGSMNN